MYTGDVYYATGSGSSSGRAQPLDDAAGLQLDPDTSSHLSSHMQATLEDVYEPTTRGHSYSVPGNDEEEGWSVFGRSETNGIQPGHNVLMGGPHVGQQLYQHGHHQVGSYSHHYSSNQGSHGGYIGGGYEESGHGGLDGGPSGSSASSTMMMGVEDSDVSNDGLSRVMEHGRYSHIQQTVHASHRGEFGVGARKQPSNATERENGAVSGTIGNSLFSDSGAPLGDGPFDDVEDGLAIHSDITPMDTEDLIDVRNSDYFTGRHKSGATFASSSGNASNSTSSPNSAIFGHSATGHSHSSIPNLPIGLARSDSLGSSSTTLHHGSSYHAHNSSLHQLHHNGSRDFQAHNGFSNSTHTNSALGSSSCEVSSQSEASPSTTASYNSISESPIASNDGIGSPHSPASAMISHSPGSVPNSALTYAPTQLPISHPMGGHHASQPTTQFSPASPVLVTSPSAATATSLSSSASRARGYDSPVATVVAKAGGAATSKKKTAAASAASHTAPTTPSNTSATATTGTKTKKRSRAPSMPDVPLPSAIANSSKITATASSAAVYATEEASSQAYRSESIAPPPAKRGQASKAPRAMALHNASSPLTPGTSAVTTPQQNSVTSPHASQPQQSSSSQGVLSPCSPLEVPFVINAKKAGTAAAKRGSASVTGATVKAGSSTQAAIPISPTSPIPPPNHKPLASSAHANSASNTSMGASNATANSNAFKIPPNLPSNWNKVGVALSPGGVYQPSQEMEAFPAMGNVANQASNGNVRVSGPHGSSGSVHILGVPDYPPRTTSAPSMSDSNNTSPTSQNQRGGGAQAKIPSPPEHQNNGPFNRGESMASRASGPHPSSPFMSNMMSHTPNGPQTMGQMPQNAGNGPSGGPVTFTPNRSLPPHTPPASRNDGLTGVEEKERGMPSGAFGGSAQTRVPDPLASATAATAAFAQLEHISHDIASMVGTLAKQTSSTEMSFHNVTTMQHLTKALRDALDVCEMTEPLLKQVHAHFATQAANSASLPLSVLSAQSKASNRPSPAQIPSLPQPNMHPGQHPSMHQPSPQQLHQQQQQMLNRSNSLPSAPLASSGPGYYPNPNSNPMTREAAAAMYAQQGNGPQSPHDISAYYNGPPRASFPSSPALSGSSSSVQHLNPTGANVSWAQQGLYQSGVSAVRSGVAPPASSSSSAANGSYYPNSAHAAPQSPAQQSHASHNPGHSAAPHPQGHLSTLSHAHHMQQQQQQQQQHPQHQGQQHPQHAQHQQPSQQQHQQQHHQQQQQQQLTQSQIQQNMLQHQMQSQMNAGNAPQQQHLMSSQQHNSMPSHGNSQSMGVSSGVQQHGAHPMSQAQMSGMVQHHARQGPSPPNYADRSVQPMYYGYPPHGASTHSPNHQ